MQKSPGNANRFPGIYLSAYLTIQRIYRMNCLLMFLFSINDSVRRSAYSRRRTEWIFRSFYPGSYF